MIRLSVVIPTRERCGLLEQCLRSCISQGYKNFEFIVSDNASSDNTAQVVKRARELDPRISYINPKRRLGMSEHWEFALRHASGDYIMVLGDDDSLMPKAGERIEDLISKYGKADQFFSSGSVYYYPEIAEKRAANTIYVRIEPGPSVHQKIEWRNAFFSGELSYGQIPGLYYGFVRRDLVSFLLNAGIRSVAPDVFAASFLAGTNGRAVRSAVPFALAGVSSKSNGFASLSLQGDAQRAKLLTQESRIAPIKELHLFPVPYDTSVALLELDAIVKLRDLSLIPVEAGICWDRLVRNAEKQLKARYPNREEELHQALECLLRALKSSRKEKWKFQGNTGIVSEVKPIQISMDHRIRCAFDASCWLDRYLSTRRPRIQKKFANELSWIKKHHDAPRSYGVLWSLRALALFGSDPISNQCGLSPTLGSGDESGKESSRDSVRGALASYSVVKSAILDAAPALGEIASQLGRFEVRVCELALRHRFCRMLIESKSMLFLRLAHKIRRCLMRLGRNTASGSAKDFLKS